MPDHIHGIASQAYFGGRAECRIRSTPVPCVLTDFSSQYPTINSLLGNPDVLNAESVTFVDVTDEVRSMVKRITLNDCFKRRKWKRFKFFARIRPDNDVMPVRAEYNDDGVTKNIGMNYFTDDEPVWLSGPDVIASTTVVSRTGCALAMRDCLALQSDRERDLQTSHYTNNFGGLLGSFSRASKQDAATIAERRLYHVEVWSYYYYELGGAQRTWGV